MDEETDVQRLNNRQKTRLRSLGRKPNRPAVPPDENEQRGDLLCDVLRHPLPLGLPEPDAPPLDPGRRFPVFRATDGPPLRERLLEPQTDVTVLRRIKEHAKVFGTRVRSDLEKDVFLAVYFAAIAAGSVHHGVRITGHSDQDLKRLFDSFARASWMPTDLMDILARAVQCHRSDK